MIYEIMVPALILGGLGLIFGTGLAYASRKFAVATDNRITQAREVLPGANCGGCGQTGCDAFAEALIQGKCKINGCPVGGEAVADKLSQILGVEAEAVVAQTALVLCGGDNNISKAKYTYSGIQDCTAAEAMYGGPMSCSYGCVGMGNCERACPFGAINIKDGLAAVNELLCTGCGKCVAACPKHIIILVPESSQYAVSCSSRDKGSIVIKNCKAGCIGCGKCVKACPVQAIRLNGPLAAIDPAICTNCGICETVCPTGVIKRRTRSAPACKSTHAAPAS